MYILVTLFLIIIVIILIRWKYRKFIKAARELKHDLLSVPLLGISYMFYGSDEDRMSSLQTLGREAIKQGGTMAVWLGHRFFVVVADAEVAQICFKNCHEKDELVSFMRFLTGTSSLTSQAPLPGRRRVVAPTFSHKNLSHYTKVFAEASQVLVELLEPKVGQPIELFPYIISYTMDTLCQTTLGVKLDVQRNSGHAILSTINLAAESISRRMVQPWLHNEFFYKLLPVCKNILKHKNFVVNFIAEIISSQRKSMQNEKKEKSQANRLKTFTELLIQASAEEKKGYTDVELNSEILALLIAGTDTAAVSISFMALLLARYPDVQAKVYQELQDVFGGSERAVETDDLPHLEYLDAVIKECLRLYPPAPVIVRRADKDVTLPSGVIMPEGSGILLHLWGINRNPRYWGAGADQFRPERFLPYRPAHPAQFSSFSFGPRNCIGSTYSTMTTKTVLATLLRQYRVLPAPESTPDKPIRTKFEIVMKEANNFRVILEPRRNS